MQTSETSPPLFVAHADLRKILTILVESSNKARPPDYLWVNLPSPSPVSWMPLRHVPLGLRL